MARNVSLILICEIVAVGFQIMFQSGVGAVILRKSRNNEDHCETKSDLSAMLPMFRIMAVLFVAISVLMGWEAQSRVICGTPGNNTWIGRETDGPLFSWIVIGVLSFLVEYFLGDGW